MTSKKPTLWAIICDFSFHLLCNDNFREAVSEYIITVYSLHFTSRIWGGRPLNISSTYTMVPMVPNSSVCIQKRSSVAVRIPWRSLFLLIIGPFRFIAEMVKNLQKDSALFGVLSGLARVSLALSYSHRVNGTWLQIWLRYLCPRFSGFGNAHPSWTLTISVWFCSYSHTNAMEPSIPENGAS